MKMVKVRTVAVVLCLLSIPAVINANVLAQQPWVIEKPAEPVGIVEGILGITSVLLTSLIRLMWSSIYALFGLATPPILSLLLFKGIRSSIQEIYSLFKEGQEISSIISLGRCFILVLPPFVWVMPLMLVALVAGIFSRTSSFLRPENIVFIEDVMPEETTTLEMIEPILEMIPIVIEIIRLLLHFI